MLVLCASYIGMMETAVLVYQAPLYGRRTLRTYPALKLYIPRIDVI